MSNNIAGIYRLGAVYNGSPNSSRPSIPTSSDRPCSPMQGVTTATLNPGRVVINRLEHGFRAPGHHTSVSSHADSTSESHSSALPDIPSQMADHHPTLRRLTALELLETDPRPSMVLDMHLNSANTLPNETGIPIIFCNRALRSITGLYKSFMECPIFNDSSPEDTIDSNFEDFREWALGTLPDQTAVHQSSTYQHAPAPIFYHGVVWTLQQFYHRYRFITGNIDPLAMHSSRINSCANIARALGTPSRPPIATMQSSTPQSTVPISATLDLSEPTPFSPGFDRVGQKTSLKRSLPTLRHNGPISIATTPSISTSTHSDQPADYVPSISGSPLPRRAGSILETKESFDWTAIPIEDIESEHVRRVRELDWSSTPLGPINQWSFALQTMANVLMSSAHPSLLWWGRELVFIYNEAYIPFLGDAHPSALGKEFPKIADSCYPRIEKYIHAAWSGKGTMKVDERSWVTRKGRKQEIYVTWSLHPVIDQYGDIRGVQALVYDTTETTLRRRRENTLRSIMYETQSAMNLDNYWERLVRSLDTASLDIPFALIYSIKCRSSVSSGPESKSRASSAGGSEDLSPTTLTTRVFPIKVVLEGKVGVPDGHEIATPEANLDETPLQSIANFLRPVMAHRSSVTLSTKDGSIDPQLLNGLGPENYLPCETVVVCPIQMDTLGSDVSGCNSTPLGFLILGVSPYTPFGADYLQFFDVMLMQLRSSLAQLLSLEHVIKTHPSDADNSSNSNKSGTTEAERTIEDLQSRMQYLKRVSQERENKFSRLTEFLPVGLFTADINTIVLTSNKKWGQVAARCGEACATGSSWLNVVADEDRNTVEKVWTQLLANPEPLSTEFRLKTAPDPIQTTNMERRRSTVSNSSCSSVGTTVTVQENWVLLSALGFRDAIGNMYAVFGCITDITAQKEAEAYEARQRLEALEQKTRQDRFIDMISHEMRNPLGVVIQCAEELETGLSQLKSGQITTKPEREAVFADFNAAIEAIQTCAAHQRSIIDDVHTLSKMDASLIQINPVAAQPLAIIHEVLCMYEGQFLKAGIKLNCTVHDSVIQTGLNAWARFDPVRLRQVLINFLSNAIKFTRGRACKAIAIKVAAAVNHDEAPNLMPGQINNDLLLHRSPLISATELLPVRAENQSQFPLKPCSEECCNPSTSDYNYEAHDIGWGNGRIVNLIVAIRDSGPGLSAETRTKLFQRFQQAVPRTHASYGSSGLGLFISRNLVELQGGRIGVASEEDIGATFTFYIKTRLCDEPCRMERSKVQVIMPPIKKSSISDSKSDKFSKSTKAIKISKVPGSSLKLKPLKTSQATSSQQQQPITSTARGSIEAVKRQPTKSAGEESSKFEAKLSSAIDSPRSSSFMAPFKKLKKLRKGSDSAPPKFDNKSIVSKNLDDKGKDKALPPVSSNVKAESAFSESEYSSRGQKQHQHSSPVSHHMQPTTLIEPAPVLRKATPPPRDAIPAASVLKSPSKNLDPPTENANFKTDGPVKPIPQEAADPMLSSSEYKDIAASNTAALAMLRGSTATTKRQAMTNVLVNPPLLPVKECLLVEDNIINAKTTVRAMGKFDSNIKHALNGVEALEIIKKSRCWKANNGQGDDIHIVLMDIEMPVMDGIECTREIRRLEQAGDITNRLLIVAVTAYSGKTFLKKCFDADMDGFVPKPFTCKHLCEQVNSIVQKRHNRSFSESRERRRSRPDNGRQTRPHDYHVSTTYALGSGDSDVSTASQQPHTTTSSSPTFTAVATLIEDYNRTPFRVPSPPPLGRCSPHRPALNTAASHKSDLTSPKSDPKHLNITVSSSPVERAPTTSSIQTQTSASASASATDPPLQQARLSCLRNIRLPSFSRGSTDETAVTSSSLPAPSSSAAPGSSTSQQQLSSSSSFWPRRPARPKRMLTEPAPNTAPMSTSNSPGQGAVGLVDVFQSLERVSSVGEWDK